MRLKPVGGCISPGPGWVWVAGPVWDHESGMRLHLYGLLILPDGTRCWADRWVDSYIADRYVRIAGGNRKRGLMAWARRRLAEFEHQKLAHRCAEGS